MQDKLIQTEKKERREDKYFISDDCNGTFIRLTSLITLLIEDNRGISFYFQRSSQSVSHIKNEIVCTEFKSR